jgi:hypothetical protein
MTMTINRKLICGLGVAVLLAGIGPPVAAIAVPPTSEPPTPVIEIVPLHDESTPAQSDSVEDDLAQVRRVTARFLDVAAAEEAGYELGWVNGSGERIITGCVANPDAGAMGFHYFNAELMDDLAVDLLEPEVLVYAPGPDGELQLNAVEWVARGANSNPAGVSEPPTVLGMPMHILVPEVGFYITHAWVWQPNPAGMFEDWNPNVTCPEREEGNTPSSPPASTTSVG